MFYGEVSICAFIFQPGFLINKVFRRARHKPRSCSKLPQVACNVDPAEKSIDPKGERFDFKRKHTFNCTVIF